MHFPRPAHSLPKPLSVRRREPELVTPASPNPGEIKRLSDIDDQQLLRMQVPFIFSYRHNPSEKERDPVEEIRKGLAKALDFYHPFAGRLIEGPKRKLSVDCTGELGVLFVEADADVELDSIEETLIPPCPHLEELLVDVPGSAGIIGCPLLLIQVTRFICGGFVFGIRCNHTMCDATGLVQFLTAIGQMVRGACVPSPLPAWDRDLLNARDPPQITYSHPEYEEEALIDTNTQSQLVQSDVVVQESFFFGPQEIKSIRAQLPSPKYSTFDALTAYLWRCRTIALDLSINLEENVTVWIVVNARGKLRLPIPPGYYGNVIGYPGAHTKAKMICCGESGLRYAANLVHEAKYTVTDESISSLVDLMEIEERPPVVLPTGTDYKVSDMTRQGFHEIDLGWWGKPVFAGIPRLYGFGSVYIRYMNPTKGFDGILVPIRLPKQVMQRFRQQLAEKVTVDEKQP